MIIFISLFLSFIFVIFHKKLSMFVNLYDFPDNSRKFHTKKVALTGGILIFFNLILIKIYLFINIENIQYLSVFENNFDFFIFSLGTTLIFLLGFFDDKYQIDPNLKFIIMSVISFGIIIFSKSLLIDKIEITFLNNIYALSFITSLLWTVVCFLLFLNALNMFDGINYQVAFYSIFISLFFILNNYFINLFIPLLISLIFFVYLNHKNKAFLGDSGSYLLAFLFSYFFVKFYNQTNVIATDQIVLFMLIPGLDLMRLFISRIYKKKSPFFPDRNHLHHLLLSNFTLFQVNLIILLLISVPSTLSYLYGYSHIFLLTQAIIYFVLILKYR